MHKQEILDNFKQVADELRNKKIPDSYWEQEDKKIEELNIKNDKIRKALEMSQDKMNKQFDL